MPRKEKKFSTLLQLYFSVLTATRVILVLLFFLSFLNLAKAIFLKTFQDFQYYYYASQVVFEGVNPYFEKGPFNGFLYPPVTLIFLYPFGVFSEFIASKIWIVLSIIFLISSILIILKIYKVKLKSHFSLFIFTLVFLYFPVRYTLGMGQINMEILFFLALALYSIYKKRDGHAGVLFGLALTVKYFPIFIIPYLLMRKKWKIIMYLFFTVVTLQILGFLFIDKNTNIYFLTTTLPSLIGSNGGYYYNQALTGFLARSTEMQIARDLLKWFISSLLLLITFIVLRKNKKITLHQFMFEIGIIINLNLLLNSFVWQHHYVWFLIPFFLTTFFIKEKKLNYKFYILMATIYLLTSFNIKNPIGVPGLMQSHTFYGGIMLWALNLYIVRKYLGK